MTTEMTDYVLALTRALRDLHSRVRAAYSILPLLVSSIKVKPGDYVLVKNWVGRGLVGGTLPGSPDDSNSV